MLIFSRTPNSSESLNLRSTLNRYRSGSSTKSFINQDPRFGLRAELFGLDWCAWVFNPLVGSVQHPLSPLFPRTPFTITQLGGEPLCK